MNAMLPFVLLALACGDDTTTGTDPDPVGDADVDTDTDTDTDTDCSTQADDAYDFLDTYCHSCHGLGGATEGGFN